MLIWRCHILKTGAPYASRLLPLIYTLQNVNLLTRVQKKTWKQIKNLIDLIQLIKIDISSPCTPKSIWPLVMCKSTFAASLRVAKCEFIDESAKRQIKMKSNSFVAPENKIVFPFPPFLVKYFLFQKVNRVKMSSFQGNNKSSCHWFRRETKASVT